jgi:hypothetical protein
MRVDQGKTIRGAVAGAVAAAVWALQMPLDKRLFGSELDDVELLGKAVTRRRSWRPIGWALHVQNGALLGAAYANIAPRIPLPSWMRAPTLALAENFGTWPLTAVSDRLHPARGEMQASFSNPRALAQATWRHLLFGVVLGELERALNAQNAIEMPVFEQAISTNGHGKLEHAAQIL